jgi:subtilisin family serine protease
MGVYFCFLELTMMKKSFPTRARAVLIFLLLLGGLSSSGAAQDPSRKLDAELSQKIDQSRPEDRIPVFILFKEQGTLDVFDGLFRGVNVSERKARTRAWLKSLSDSTFDKFWARIKASGLEKDYSPARRFWLVNGCEAVFTARALREAASWPEISRIYLRTEKPDDFVKKDKKWARLAVPQPWPIPDWKGPFVFEGKELSWNLKIIRAPDVWRQGITGRGVIVAVLDSGMNITHPDIRGNLWVNKGEVPENDKDDDGNGYIDDYLGWNFAEDNQNIVDDFFHGTIVGGLVAGNGTGGIVTGVAPQATVMVLKTYAYDRTKKYGARFLWQAFQYDMWLALQYALDQGAQVANFSIDYQPSEKPLFAPWRSVLANATHCGMTVIAGAGNSRSWLKDPDQITPPANVPEVIAVGGTAENDTIDRVSSRGPVTWQNVAPFNDFSLPPGLVKPDLCAPIGRCPYISFSSNGYDVLSGEGGTSSSSPHAAGVAALMLEKDPDLMPWEVKQRMEETSLERGAPGKDNYYGWGRIDAFESVNYGTSPNIRLMAWSVNGNREPALAAGQKVDIDLDFAVSACRISQVRLRATSSDQDLVIRGEPQKVTVPEPRSGVQHFRAKIEGLVSEKAGPGKTIAVRLSLSAEKGRTFYFEVPVRVGPSDLLVIDDDGEGENEKPILEGLERAGRFCHIMKSPGFDEEKAARYRTIIWTTGEEFSSTLDGREQAFLIRFLDRGGRLLLLGDNIGDDLGKADFYKDYLHARVVKETLSGRYAKVESKIIGYDGDPLSRRLFVPAFTHYKQYDLIRPVGEADDPFHGDDDTTYMGFVRYAGRYRMVYTSLGMEAVEDIAARALLLDRILEWLEQ